MISKIAYIKHLSDGRWRVFSRLGKNLGTYNSKRKAELRLKQIEMFKHMKRNRKKRKKAFTDIKDNLSNNEITFSSAMRDINRSDPIRVKKMMSEFKDAFDNALINQLNNPDKVALMQMLKKQESLLKDNIFKFSQTIVEMGDPSLAGKTIANVIKFLIQNLPKSERDQALKTLRNRVLNVSEYEVSSKSIPPSASLGQSIAFIKNMLSGHNPSYIRDVLQHTIKYMY